MISQLCAKLKDRIVLANLPFLETVAGVAKAVTYIENDFETGKPKTKTIPVACDHNIDVTGPQERDLVPDSSKKGILYFEENGAEKLREYGPGTEYVANVTCVCWYNRELITGGTYDKVQTHFIQLLRTAIGGEFQPFNTYPFTRVMVNLQGIAPQDASVFSRYTYDETERQYLMAPYEHFALRLQIKFTVGRDCLLHLESSPTNC
jgi:hypothetical protein